MKVFILTQFREGTASRCLPTIHRTNGIELCCVIYASPRIKHKVKYLKSKFRKVLRIGILGAINGILLRKWFAEPRSDDIEKCAHELGVKFFEVADLNSNEVIEIIHSTNADLGISLGCSYIAPKIFESPTFGMLNVHGELLPKFRGGQSVIWAIYEGDSKTGLTVHKISQKIDAGEILLKKMFPIDFRATLKDTVRVNVKTIQNLTPSAIAEVLTNYSEYLAKAETQGNGRSYTTPDIFQFWKMARNNRREYRRKVGKR